MAIQLGTIESRLERTTDLVDFNNAYTAMFWVNHLDANRGFRSLINFNSLTANFNSDSDSIYVTNNNLEIRLEIAINRTDATVSATAEGYGWIHVALRRISSSSISLIVNGNESSTVTTNVSTRVAITHQQLFNKKGSNEGFQNPFCQFYLYDVALSNSEIEDQKNFAYPRRTANLREWLPMDSGADRNVDFSSNGRNYTESGTVNNADGLVLARPNLLFRQLLPRTVRIACGRTSTYTDTLGRVWAADNSFVGATTASRFISISNTSDLPLFQFERSANAAATFSYLISIPNGTYTLKLGFAEIFLNSIGQRVFNVFAQGSQILFNYDIILDAGTNNRATIKSFEITVLDGIANVEFRSITDNAKISNIEIVAQAINVIYYRSPLMLSAC